MNEQQAAIEIRDVSYSYKSDWSLRRFPGLQNLTLSVAQGESFGFLGHNGAGKTTTIKCILGLMRIDRGSIRILGEPVPASASRRWVGYLPEQPYFYDHLSVTELLHMYATLAGVEAKQRKSHVEEAISMVSMQDKARAKMRTLSKGLTQRVALAQAIVAKPRLLILDEPFSGLDPIGRRQFANIFLHLHETGTTIFMSSHILKDVEFLCQRVSIMVNGKLEGVFDLQQDLSQLTGGSYELVLRNYEAILPALMQLGERASQQEKLLRMHFRDRDAAERALALAIEARAGVESYQFQHGSLEDLFISLVERKNKEARAE